MSGARDRRRSRGQGVAEFAIVLPIFLVLVFAIIDLGRVIWATDDLANAAREAARYASVHGGSEITSCPTGPHLDGVPAGGCPAWSPDSKEPTRAEARRFLVAPGTDVIVEVCYFDSVPCTGDTDEANASNLRGEFVHVSVRSRVDLITAALLGMTGFDVSGDSTVIVNN
jgi:hypothetical protein